MSNLGKVVKFTNITNEDFSHAFGGTPFFVKAGETMLLPFELAEHLAKHLARKILLNNDKSLKVYNPNDLTGGTGQPIWTQEEEIKKMGEIMGEVMERPLETEKTETEKLQEQIAKLNEFVVEKLGPQEASLEASLEASVTTSSSEVGYKDKADVIAELTKRGISFDARLNKSNLEKLLK